jgi:hypothetical protein
MIVMAGLYNETGRFEQALESASGAREILALNLPAGHWRLSAAQLYEGLALAGLGEIEKAEPLLLASVEGLDESPIPGLAKQAQEALAAFYVNSGRPDLAAASKRP